MSSPLAAYERALEQALQTGDATEHTHRPALVQLIQHLQPDARVINEPKRIACGAPDLAVQRTLGGVPFTVGYIETKDVDASLDEAERSEQLMRYRTALPNLILTNYREFRWYVEGELRRKATLTPLSPLSHSVGEGGADLPRPCGGRGAGGEGDGDSPLPRRGRGAGGEGEILSLLLDFLHHTPQPIADADELATRMARYAHLMRDTLIATFQQGRESELLHDLRRALAETLLPDLDQPEHLPEFADMLAQTLAYGLFAARCHHHPDQPFTRASAAHEIPRTNPFLRQLFDTLNSPELETEPFVAFLDDLVSLLHRADMRTILEQFTQRTGREDAVVHFYETFLKAYDPRLRELRGVYYTPEPVVDYLVRSVHRLLQTEFGLVDGLATLGNASPLYILDPACGTGSFLAHILQFIREYLHTHGLGGLWNDETRADLMQRLFGFELLMAPYVIAHLKLGLILQEDPHPPAPSPTPWERGSNAPLPRRGRGAGGEGANRLGVYLTNTLELPSEQIPMHLGPWRILSEEAIQANRIKRDTPILVVIGNPPYSGHSANQVEWLETLLKRDYYPKDDRKEQNPKMLLDDYVKFIRWAQWRLEQTGQGILAFITNHSYLDNPTFRGMRRALMNAFDALYILDLHGNARRKELAPDGGKDENVFDIQQGTAILLAVKRGDAPSDGCAVYHYDLWGRRATKYEFLKAHDVSTTPWRRLSPQPPLYLFTPFDASLQAEYEQGWLLTNIFRVHSTGVKTHRDHFVIDFDRPTLERRIQAFRDLSIPDATLRQRYQLNDTRDWKLTPNRERLAHEENWQAYFQPILYRPFDVRWIYYTPTVVELPREEVMGHMLRGANVGLISARQQSQSGRWALVGVSDKLIECCAISNKTREANYVFPLYLYHQEVDSEGVVRVVREPNLRAEFVRALEAAIGTMASPPSGTSEPSVSTAGTPSYQISPESILAYIYAVLHAPSYRARYAEFLRRDFPRIPLPRNAPQFHALAALGQELIDLHLLRHPQLAHAPVKFPVAGSNTVEKGFPRYADGRVWINGAQYFEGVEETVWRFQVGGYPVCDKWLKDRRGRALTNAEIQTYRQIVYALSETLRLMGMVDELFASSL